MNILKTALLVSVCSVGACHSRSDTNTTANLDSNATVENVAADIDANVTGAANLDAAFLTEAMKGDNGEVAIGNLAATQASSQAAKDFGRMLASDHGAHKEKLAALGSTAGIAATDELADEAKTNLSKLKGLAGAEFDKEFARMMVEDHTKDIAKYEKQASGGDPQTAALARDTLPTLRKHLQTAQSL